MTHLAGAHCNFWLNWDRFVLGFADAADRAWPQAPPAPPKIDFLPATTKGIKENFYEYLDAALQFVPETSEDKSIRTQLARIGIGPGQTFAFKDLSLEHKAAVLLGLKEGADAVEKYRNTGMKTFNGWKVGSVFGDAAFYQGNWLRRAAKGGIFGP